MTTDVGWAFRWDLVEPPGYHLDMSMAETPQPGYDVVVGDDGISSETLARFDIRPGMRLHLVPEPEARPRKKLKGALQGLIDVEVFEEAMAWHKQQRIADVMSEDDNARGSLLIRTSSSGT